MWELPGHPTQLIMFPTLFREQLFAKPLCLDPSMAKSPFLKAPHPKVEIKPTEAAIQKILSQGWVGQLKIHGHRAQIHLSTDPKDEILVYNRHGRPHARALSPVMASEVRRIFGPLASEGWIVLDAEWLKPEEKLYVFDLLKVGDEVLRKYSYLERWKRLPRAYLSPCVQTLGVLTDLEACLPVFRDAESRAKWIEGLVFKSPSPGFEDSSIIRCRI